MIPLRRILLSQIWGANVLDRSTFLTGWLNWQILYSDSTLDADNATVKLWRNWAVRHCFCFFSTTSSPLSLIVREHNLNRSYYRLIVFWCKQQKNLWSQKIWERNFGSPNLAPELWLQLHIFWPNCLFPRTDCVMISQQNSLHSMWWKVDWQKRERKKAQFEAGVEVWMVTVVNTESRNLVGCSCPDSKVGFGNSSWKLLLEVLNKSFKTQRNKVK